jgi:glycosyltransferase involved in cell wall biosynthesis
MSISPRIDIMIPTFNEADHIAETVANARELGDVYVLDSISTDGTQQLARDAGATVVERAFTNYSDQKNWGLDNLPFTGDWIFILDADERVTPKLRDEILRTLEGDLKYWAYSVGRLNFMMGKPVRFSGLQRDRVTRLFHRGHARYPNKRVHADLLVDGETGALHHKMDHFYIRTFDHMIAKMTRYADWGAAQMFIDGKTTSAWGIFSHSVAKFVRDFIFNLGFLDGVRGLISVGMHVYYTFWKYAKLWELTQLKRLGKPVPLPKLDESDATWELPWVKNGGS